MHAKKLVAPIIITAIMVLFLLAYVVGCFFVDGPVLIKLAFSLIPLALMGVSVFVLIERIHEVRSGEEDDLSKY